MKREIKTLDLPSGASVAIWPASMFVVGECSQAKSEFDAARILIAKCTGDIVFKHGSGEIRYDLVCKAPDKCANNEMSIDELDPEDQVMLSEQIKTISKILNTEDEEVADADNKSEAADKDAPVEAGNAD